MFIIFIPVSLPPYKIKFNQEIWSHRVSQTPGIYVFFSCLFPFVFHCWTPEDQPIFVSISRYPFQFDNEIACIAWARHPCVFFSISPRSRIDLWFLGKGSLPIKMMLAAFFDFNRAQLWWRISKSDSPVQIHALQYQNCCQLEKETRHVESFTWLVIKSS